MIYPKVSIIILNWNGLDDTIECLESLKKITYPNYDVIVVDNASSGNDVAVLRERFGDYAHIIQNDENYGFARGNNVGIRYAMEKGSNYVMLLNNDTTVAPTLLDQLVGVAETDQRVGILGPNIYDYYQPDKTLTLGPATVDWWRNTAKSIPSHGCGQVIMTEYIIGAAMLISRKTIETIGPLPEEYFLGVEDMDYCVHASRAGIGIAIVTKAIIWHKCARSKSRMSRDRLSAFAVYHQYRGFQIMRRKYLSKTMYLLTTVTSLLWATWRVCVRLFQGDIRTLPKVIREGIKGILRGAK